MAKAVDPFDVDAIRRKTVSDMKALRVYKKQYDPLIKIYAELVTQYNRLTEEFADSGYEVSTGTGQGGSKKHPRVATLEALRKDILAYSDRLCLNPKSLEAITVEKEGQSKLAAALKGLR